MAALPFLIPEISVASLLSYLSRAPSRAPSPRPSGHPRRSGVELEELRFGFRRTTFILCNPPQEPSVSALSVPNFPVRQEGDRDVTSQHAEAREAGGGRQERPLPQSTRLRNAGAAGSRPPAHAETLLEQHAAIMRHRPPAPELM